MLDKNWIFKQLNITSEDLERAEITIRLGEGVEGHTEKYEGKKTVKAIEARLAKEICNGERFARANIVLDGFVYQID